MVDFDPAARHDRPRNRKSHDQTGTTSIPRSRRIRNFGAHRGKSFCCARSDRARVLAAARDDLIVRRTGLAAAVGRPEVHQFENLDTRADEIRSQHLVAGTGGHPIRRRIGGRAEPLPSRGLARVSRALRWSCIIEIHRFPNRRFTRFVPCPKHSGDLGKSNRNGALRLRRGGRISRSRVHDAVVEQAHAPDAADTTQVKVEILVRVSETLLVSEQSWAQVMRDVLRRGQRANARR